MKKETWSKIGYNSFLGFALLLMCAMITTCIFEEELTYDNIKSVPVKMVVTNEIYRVEREGKTDKTNFYLRVKSPFTPTPEPDYLINQNMCPTARKEDTIIFLVRTSNTFKHEWYSPVRTEILFKIEKPIKVIKK